MGQIAEYSVILRGNLLRLPDHDGRKSMRSALLALWIGACCLALPAQAFNYNFTIDGAQAGTGSPGTGTGFVSLVDQSAAADDWLLSWNITFSGLGSNTTLAHFHGPAPPGTPAGVRVGTLSGLGGTSGNIVGNAVISDAYATEVMSGLWYHNIHTVNFPGGEIRGQLVPEPATWAMLVIGFFSFACMRRFRRRE